MVTKPIRVSSKKSEMTPIELVNVAWPLSTNVSALVGCCSSAFLSSDTTGTTRAPNLSFWSPGIWSLPSFYGFLLHDCEDRYLCASDAPYRLGRSLLLVGASGLGKTYSLLVKERDQLISNMRDEGILAMLHWVGLRYWLRHKCDKNDVVDVSYRRTNNAVFWNRLQNTHWQNVSICTVKI